MKILFVTDGIHTPASRFRCSQFFEHFEKSGIEVDIRYGYGAAYNDAINRPYALAYKAIGRLRRAYHQLFYKDADLIFLQRTAFPHSGLVEEVGSMRDVPIIFDFDDSLFVNGKGEFSARRGVAFATAVRVSNHLIAGNRYLANQAGRLDKTTIIPTVIDTEMYRPRIAPKSNAKIVVGWMGTAGNFPFLESLVPELRLLLDRRSDVIVRIVSNRVFKPLAGVERVQQIQWSPQLEVDWLQSFDIGLMPLVDSPLTRGKCAFKMIQYMAVGIPVVVSPVGANLEVFESKESIGFMPTGEWFEALDALVDDTSLRRRMGAAGRERAVAEYSIESVLPRYLNLFELVGG
ncbi:glycosyltransferase family 4 protein [Microvenator marinus]|uniref:Glycosyltransferase family 4 protein n=1 Tax=Microvenator marinus TaxID=2600177 RepID=A0A5B8XT21_9DELT|nr:glycosyltransferase family 4 protein [Microvenator marinus]QED28704.1 glycosyltransferase family 4 protein [Microvenator marinus]